MVEIAVQEIQVEEASFINKDNMIDMTSSNQVDEKRIMLQKDHVEIIEFEFKSKPIIKEDPKIIDMILPIHSGDKKVILEADITVMMKLIGENIERRLRKDLKGLEGIHSYKTLPF